MTEAEVVPRKPNRKRSATLTFRLLPAEHERLRKTATDAGVSMSSVVLRALQGCRAI